MTDLRSITEVALDLIKEHVHPFVEKNLSLPYREGTRLTQINEYRKDDGLPPYQLPFSNWAPDWLLWVMVNHPKAFERDSFDRSVVRSVERFWPSWIGTVNRLLDARNRWAHRNNYSDGDTLVFTGDAAFLLKVCGARHAAALLEEKLLNLDRRPFRTHDEPLTVSLIEPYRIRHSYEPEFSRFLALMARAFHPSMRDLDEDLERWLERTPKYLTQKIPVEGIYLVARHTLSHMVVALLFASHFQTLDFLFISYLARDKGLASEVRARGDYRLAEEIDYNATRILLSDLVERTIWTRGILAEVAHDDHAAELTELFRSYGRQLLNKKLYKLVINYIRPALNPRELHDTPTHDLLYMPSIEHQEIIDNNNDFLPKETATEIITFIYDYVYGGNFKDLEKEIEIDTTYRAHVAEIRDRVVADLEELVPIKDLSPW